MWYDKSGKDTCPDRYIENIKDIKRICSNFEYIFWDNSKINKLWKDPRLNKWKRVFYKLEHHIEKCDFTRYAILYLYGGVYIDLDFYINKDISPLIKDKDLLLCREPIEHEEAFKFLSNSSKLITNSVMGSCIGNQYWINIMEFISDNYCIFQDSSMKAVATTGPMVLAKIYYSGNYTPVLDYCNISPLTSKKEISRLCKDRDSYLYTKWDEGTNWSYDYSKYNWLVAVIIIMLIVAFIGVFLSF
jgi:mannosyltransferase OCH1-like enzyme